MIKMEKIKYFNTYKAKGYVLGKFKDGLTCVYEAKRINGLTEKKFIKYCNENLQSLDSGMGYDEIIGCAYRYTITRTVEIAGKKFLSKDSKRKFIFIGKLSENQKEFLVDCYYRGWQIPD